MVKGILIELGKHHVKILSNISYGILIGLLKGISSDVHYELVDDPLGLDQFHVIL